ncbi:hypothetical protein BDF19DRAFT_411231 [Syncephalis fuscata]|nr:hypothetical protein BDF19DRAFT_411231 [Syncephalis fuscata]
MTDKYLHHLRKNVACLRSVSATRFILFLAFYCSAFAIVSGATDSSNNNNHNIDTNKQSLTKVTVNTVSIGKRCGIADDLYRCMDPLVCDIKPGQPLGLCKRSRDAPVYFNEPTTVDKLTSNNNNNSDNSNHNTQHSNKQQFSIDTVVDQKGIKWQTIDYGRTWSMVTATKTDLFSLVNKKKKKLINTQ